MKGFRTSFLNTPQSEFTLGSNRRMGNSDANTEQPVCRVARQISCRNRQPATDLTATIAQRVLLKLNPDCSSVNRMNHLFALKSCELRPPTTIKIHRKLRVYKIAQNTRSCNSADLYRVEQVMWPHFAWSVRAPRVSPDDLVVSTAKLTPSTFIFTALESFSVKMGLSIDPEVRGRIFAFAVHLTRPLPSRMPSRKRPRPWASACSTRLCGPTD